MLLSLKPEYLNRMIYSVYYFVLFWVKLVFFTYLEQDTPGLINVGISPIIAPAAFDFHDEPDLSYSMLNIVVSKIIIFGAELLTTFQFPFLFGIIFFKFLFPVPSLNNHRCLSFTFIHLSRI